MKIGFDARMIKHPGIGRYIKSLLPELLKQGRAVHEFVLFGDTSELGEIAEKGGARVVQWNAPIYSVQEQIFPKACIQGIDVLHVPHFNIPVLCPKKLIVTIHDLIYLLFPEALNVPFGRQYARFMIGSALKKSDKVITVSEHTRNDIKKLFGTTYYDKINVVYEAADRDFHRVEDKTRIADLQCRYRLSDRIILYVGSIKPHKNVGTLMKVFELLKQWGLPHQLVICGRWDKKEDALKDKVGVPSVKYIGEIPFDDLNVLYSMADVLVHLSRYEGFGLTVLEAMQCGTPVVASDSSSLPEVVGDAALTVRPDNIHETADIVYNVLMNPQMREDMIEAGQERAKRFSWKSTASKTLKIYNDLRV